MFRSASDSAGEKQIRFRITIKIRAQHGLPFRADEDASLLSMMFGLVMFGSVNPNAIRLKRHVAGTEQTDFTKATAAEQLQLDHRGHNSRQVCQRVRDDAFCHRLNPCGLDSIGATTFEARDCSQRLIDRKRRTKAIEIAKTIKAAKDKFLEYRRAKVQVGERSVAGFDNVRRLIETFAEFIGEASHVDSINSELWQNWYLHIANRIALKKRGQEGWSSS